MLDPRVLWLLLYVAANVAALIWCLTTGELLGDGAGFAVREDALLWRAFMLLLLSMFALYGLFSSLCRVDFHLRPARPDGRIFGTALGVLLACFVAYVQVTGLFVAGSAERGGTLLSALFVVFNVDLLFLIYYATNRADPGFRWVALIWLVSIAQRGWFAYIFLIAALELLRLIRLRKLRLRWVAAMGCVVLAYPFLDALKVFIRMNPGADIMAIAGSLRSIITDVDLGVQDGLLYLYESLVGRMQVLSHAYLIFENDQYFRGLVDSGSIAGFWREGYFGLLFDRLLGFERLPGSAQALAEFIAPNLQSSWNVNPSIIGWFSIYSASFPLALVYVLLLCLLSFLLLERFASDVHSRDALWVYWMVLIVPGWVAQFSSLVGVLLLVTVIDLVLRAFDIRAVGARARWASVSKVVP